MQGIHRKIEKAVIALNAKRGLDMYDAGYLVYADIAGYGVFRPVFYARLNGGGVTGVTRSYRQPTLKDTLQFINDIVAGTRPDFINHRSI